MGTFSKLVSKGLSYKKAGLNQKKRIVIDLIT